MLVLWATEQLGAAAVWASLSLSPGDEDRIPVAGAERVFEGTVLPVSLHQGVESVGHVHHGREVKPAFALVRHAESLYILWCLPQNTTVVCLCVYVCVRARAPSHMMCPEMSLK